jgi:structural maintenance of chromosome 4
LEATLAKDAKILAKATMEASVVETAIKDLEKEIANVGGVRLRAQKSKVDGLADQIQSLQSRASKANVDSKAPDRSRVKLEKKMASDATECEENKKHMEAIRAEFQVIEAGAIEVMEAHKKAEQFLEEKTETMATITKDHEDVKAEVTKLQKIELDLDQQLEDYNRGLKENQQKDKHWSKRLDGLVMHKIGMEGDEEEEMEETPAEENNADDASAVPAMSAAARRGILPVLEEEELKELKRDGLEYEITVLEERLAAQKPNLAAIKEYYKKEEEYLLRVAELDKITEQRDAVRDKFEDLRKKRLDTFMSGFSIITMRLKEMYQMITLGGDAELELVDRLNPFSEGIVFSVRPPKKSWKNISNLSGGEKTLSSLALVFALHHFKPTPLYVMDEIDAALDFKNVSIVANYIKERTKNAQFIIISLRNNMFELADRLIGIYKTEDCTKSVTITPKLIASAAEAINAAGPAAVATAAKVFQAGQEEPAGPLAV